MPLTETRGIGIRGCLADSLRSDPSVAGRLAHAVARAPHGGMFAIYAAV